MKSLAAILFALLLGVVQLACACATPHAAHPAGAEDRAHTHHAACDEQHRPMTGDAPTSDDTDHDGPACEGCARCESAGPAIVAKIDMQPASLMVPSAVSGLPAAARTGIPPATLTSTDPPPRRRIGPVPTPVSLKVRLLN